MTYDAPNLCPLCGIEHVYLFHEERCPTIACAIIRVSRGDATETQRQVAELATYISEHSRPTNSQGHRELFARERALEHLMPKLWREDASQELSNPRNP